MPSMLGASNITVGPLAKLSNGPEVGYDLSRVGAGLTRGPNEGKVFEAAPWSQTWPAPSASLDLDFANDRGYVRGVGQGRSMDAVTFTRASSANWVDSTGVLRTGAGTFTGTANAEGKNLITSPQTFDSGWVRENTTVTNNFNVAPDGTLTAYGLTNTATTAVHTIYVSPSITLPASTAHTLSMYVRYGSVQYVAIGIYNSVGTAQCGAGFDLINGTVTGTGAAGSGYSASDAAISDVGNGWYRISVVCTSPATSNFPALAHRNTSYSSGAFVQNYAETTANFTSIWGAQLELGSTATEYFPTNINQPRFDWASTAQLAPSGIPSTYEKTVASRVGVNLLTYSEEFNNAAWAKQTGSISATNSAVAPDGTTTADTWLQPASPGVSNIRQAINLSSAGIITASIYAKAVSGSHIVIAVADSASLSNGFQSWFNISTGVAGTFGTFGSGATVTSASITSVGSDWYRIVVTGQVGESTAGVALLLYISNADNSGTRLANGSCYLWGAQLERVAATTPLTANPTSNGLLIEESRTNRILWNRDATGPSRNLLLYSEQFDNAYWQKTARATITINQVTAPDGTFTADQVTTNTANSGGTWLQIPNQNAGTYTFSARLKYGTSTWICITFGISNNAVSKWYNIQNGVLGTGTTTGSNISLLDSSIYGTTNDFYVCTLTFSSTFNTNANYIYVDCDADLSLQSTLNNYTYIWGAQLDRGSTASTYEQTTDKPAIWDKTNTTAAKDQTGIDGVANAASSLTATADGGTCIQTITLASGSRTGSVYLKRITGTGTVQVSLDGSTWSTVDLSASEWRRIVLSGTVTNPTVGIKIATSGDAVAMDYAQVEDGAFATTPILTTTATVTRSADVGSVSLNALVPTNYKAVSYYVEFTKDTSTNNSDLFAVGGTALSATNIRFSVTSTIIEYIFTGVSSGSGTKQNGLNKAVLSATITSGIGGSNGTTAGERGRNNTAPFPTIQYGGGGQAVFLGQFGNSTGFLNGTIKRFAIIPTYLSSNAVVEITK